MSQALRKLMEQLVSQIQLLFLLINCVKKWGLCLVTQKQHWGREVLRIRSLDIRRAETLKQNNELIGNHLR